MAKVVGPLHSTEARGSVGSLTYNTWRGIRTVKTRAGPEGPATGQRLAIMLLGKAASINWGVLTDPQRAAWNAFGNRHTELDWTNSARRLSGHSWYVRCYVRRALIGAEPPVDPPIDQITSHVHLTDLVESEGNLALFWTHDPAVPPETEFLEIYLAVHTSPGRTLTLHDARRIGVCTLAMDELFFYTPVDPKQTVFARIITYSGLVGPWSSITLTVT